MTFYRKFDNIRSCLEEKILFFFRFSKVEYYLRNYVDHRVFAFSYGRRSPEHIQTHTHTRSDTHTKAQAHAHAHLHTHARMHARKQVHTQTHTRTHDQTQTHTPKHRQTLTHAHTHARIQTHMHAHTNADRRSQSIILIQNDISYKNES